MNACNIRSWLKQYRLYIYMCVDRSSSNIGRQCGSHEVHLSTFTRKALTATTLSES